MIILEGFISVEAAFRGENREITRLHVDESKQELLNTRTLLHYAEERNVAVELKAADTIDALAEGRTHGGILAEAGPRRFSSLDELSAPDCPFIAMLDGVEDPYTLGYAARALYAAGADGLVVRPRNWKDSEKIIVRASAGAAELLPTATVKTPGEAAAFFRDKGLRICATGRGKGDVSIYESEWHVPLFLLIGGERRGIRRSFIDKADEIRYIPYARDFNRSMGTVSAVSIIAFEAMRRREEF